MYYSRTIGTFTTCPNEYRDLLFYILNFTFPPHICSLLHRSTMLRVDKIRELQN